MTKEQKFLKIMKEENVEYIHSPILAVSSKLHEEKVFSYMLKLDFTKAIMDENNSILIPYSVIRLFKCASFPDFEKDNEDASLIFEDLESFRDYLNDYPPYYKEDWDFHAIINMVNALLEREEKQYNDQEPVEFDLPKHSSN